MCRITLTAVSVLVAAGAAPAGDPAAEVRAVFTAKCAGCHGPDLARPKGRFGYVLDLARVAGNLEMVVPGEPDQSELWELVRRNEMPPTDSPTGPLTAGQKETIRGWIAAGAPGGEPAGDTPPENSMLRRIGRLHVVIVHFPIALLIAAAAGEAWSIWNRRPNPEPAVHFCVMLGAAGAMAAAALGWLLAPDAAGDGLTTTLGLHHWLGTATAGWAVFTAVLSVRDNWRGVRSGRFRAALLIAAVLVGGTGHLGGTLVFGRDFLTAG